MGYDQTNFASYSDLRPATDEQHEPDDTMLKGIIYVEARPLFDSMAHVIGQYVATKQERKLYLFFEMMQESLNSTIDMLTEGCQAPGEQDAQNVQ